MKIKTIITVLLLFVSVAVYGSDYVIGEGDVLYVSVWGEETLSLSVKVRPDGKITIPALGDVEAAGFVPDELQKTLTKKLKKIIKKPVVTVIVQEINNNKIYVFGDGVKASVYNLDRRTTLLQILCQIEDIGNANLKNAYVMRAGEGIKENFNRLFLHGDVEEDVTLKPDDIIFIPSVFENVYVSGAVRHPKYIRYREGMTVMEAILSAGGFTKVAKKNGTVIYRKVGGNEISIPVKIKKFLKGGKFDQNVKLLPGDYIVVKERFF
jgi:polysaccharide export outer membrane protein